jgi:uncharacterized coiled-coil DUF342 family protein
MAAQADGIILINTAINKDGAIDDIGALKDALRELTAVVKELTNGLTNSLSGAGKQATKAADQIESISDSAKEAKDSVQSLKEQMDKISIDRGEDSGGAWDDESRISHARGEFQEYGNTVQQFVDSYTSGMDKADQSTNEFKAEISSLTKQLKDLESQGLYFGDEQYDETYMKLARVKQALVDYKREMLNPTEGPKINMESLQGQVDSLKRKLQQLTEQGKTFGDSLYDSTYQSLNKAQAELKGYKKSLLETDQGQKQVKKSSDGMKKSLDKTSKSANGARKQMNMLSMLGKSIVFSFVFRALSTVTNSIKEGFQNLSRYSKDTNKSLSLLMSSLTMLKNSFSAAFAPILTMIAPALSSLISKLVEANNWIAQTMAALAGKDTFVKAVAVQEDYAASLSDTQKAAKEAAKEVKKASFAFDTLMQIQRSADTNEYKGPTPDQMFKTIAVGTEAKALAEDIKSTLANLFEPLKASWDQYGASTTNAAKIMLGSLKQLAKDVGASFMQVWKDEGYGKAITDDLLITFSNFALTVANLANQFDKAWINANTGTSIMRHLGDLVLLVTGFFREASESIKNWAATLDFSPLLIAFDGVLASLIPIVSVIGSALLWLLNNVLLPLTKWAIEKALPVGLDLVSAALKVLNSVIDALKPLALWLWEEFLKPFGEWAGEVIIDALKKVTEKLKGFSDWIDKHKDEVALMTEYVLAFFAAWKVAEFVGKITTMISKMGSLGGALLTLASKLGITQLAFLGVVAAAAALVAGALEVYKNWDKMTPPEKFISTLLVAAGAAAALAVATHAVAGPAAAAAIGIAIASGLAAALLAINAGKRSSASSTSSGGGGRSYATAYSSAPYAAYSANMPRLATGTVVPPKAGEFAAILGDNNKDYEVVSPLETMKQAFKEAIGEMGGIGGGTVQADMIVDGAKFGQLVYKYNNNEKQRVGVRMVTNGG